MFLNKVYSRIEQEGMQLHYNKYVESLENSCSYLLNEIQTKEQLSYIRIGDIEASYLLLQFFPKHSQAIRDKLWFCGMDKNRIPNTKQFIDALHKTDIVGVQEPWVVDNFGFWGSTYIALQKYNILNLKKWQAVHSIYKIAASGELFKALQGKRICLVGAKSRIFKDFFWNLKSLRDSFPELELEKLEIVNCIETVDAPNNALNKVEDYLKQIRSTYGQVDSYLFSCGILPKFIAHTVAQESGKQALDVGNIFESIMNLANKRPFMEKFLSWEHPNYKFVIGQHMEIRNIIKK